MAQDEDLEALGPGVWATLATAGDETDEGDEDEIEERQHRSIVPGGSCTNHPVRSSDAVSPLSRPRHPRPFRRQRWPTLPRRPGQGPRDPRPAPSNSGAAADVTLALPATG